MGTQSQNSSNSGNSEGIGAVSAFNDAVSTQETEALSGKSESSLGNRDDGVIDVSGSLSFDDIAPSMFKPDSKKAKKAIEENDKDESDNGQLKEKKETVDSSDISDASVKEQAAIEKQVKKLLAKLGDDEYEIPEDLTIPVKINGKMEQAKLADLVSGYSGTTAISRKFNDLDKQRKQFEADLREAQELKSIRSKLKETGEKSALEMLNQVVDLVGLDGYNIFNKLRNELMPDVQNYLEMDEVGRRAYDLEQENKFLVKKHETLKSKQETELQVNKVKSEIAQLKETHKLSDDEFKDAYKFLVDSGVKDLTPTIIAKQATEAKKITKVFSILERINPSLIDNKDLVMLLKDDVDSFSEEELISMVSESLGNRIKQQTMGKTEVPRRTMEREYTSFSDFDQEY